MPSASEILFQAIQDSNYDPIWEDLTLPGGRSLRTWQDGYRSFPQVPGFTPSGITIPPRHSRTEPSRAVPGRRTLAPKPPMLSQPGPSAAIGSPATQSPLVTQPTAEPSQTGRRKRGRPSKKDTAARREREVYERQAKQEQESQMSISDTSFLFSQGTQGPGPSGRAFASIPESPTSHRYVPKRSTPRVPSNNGSSGNSGSSSGRRKRRQSSKNPATTGPPPSFALVGSVEGRYGQPEARQPYGHQSEHQRTSSFYGGQQGPPLPPPRTSSIHAASSQAFGLRHQSQPPQHFPQQQPPTSQQESRSGQSRSEGKSQLKNLLNEQ
jgi:hypothetical protein